MGHPVIALDLLSAMLAELKNDRPPSATLEACIDPVSLSLDFSLKVGIPLDMAPRRRPKLDKSKLPLVTGVSLQKRLDGLEALDDALRVIHAVDADPDECRFDAQFPEQRAAFVIRTHPPCSIRSIAGKF